MATPSSKTRSRLLGCRRRFWRALDSRSHGTARRPRWPWVARWAWKPPAGIQAFMFMPRTPDCEWRREDRGISMPRLQGIASFGEAAGAVADFSLVDGGVPYMGGAQGRRRG